MSSEQQPIFDLSVPDWEYIGFYVAYFEVPNGTVDVHSLIYRDEFFNAKVRFKFPSGNGLVFEKNNFERQEKDCVFDEVKRIIYRTARSVYGCKCPTEEFLIVNPTTKGQHLFNLILEHPNLSCNFKEM